MWWFVLAMFGYLLLALVFILDKLILTKSVERPAVYTFYSTIFLFVALLVLPFGGGRLFGIDWLWAIVSGLGFGFGLWAMFMALHHGETSHISPAVGAMVTISTLGLSCLFLGETLTLLQQAGIIILVLATVLLSYEKSRQHSGFHIGFVWAGLAGISFGISHVAAKYIYELYPFITGFIWTRATIGLVGLITLFVPAVRSALFSKKPKSTEVEQRFSKRHALAIVVSDKFLGVAGVLLIQFAISIGSVTLVNALSSAQYVLMFLFVFLLTKFAPKIFSEYFTTREIAVQIIALLLVCVGSVFLVI